MKKFPEIMGKYRILDENVLGLKGLPVLENDSLMFNHF